MNRRRASLVLGFSWVFGATVIEPGCGPAPASDESEPLRIAAASDLRRALPKVLDRFRDRDAEIDVTFGASGQLAEQIRAGAPFDVFFSADMAFVEGLKTEGVVEPDSVVPYARGTLVLAVHQSAAGAVDRLADLEKPGVHKLAIANPRFAPYGRAASQALERAGLTEAVTPKLVLAESVRQALLYVEQGNAEAALVSRSLIVDGAGLKLIEIDSKLYDPLIQGVGVVARSDKLDRARRFVAFVVGPTGQAILGERGFKAPEGFVHGG